MGKKLVIVESPAKAKTIGKLLGTGYVVKSSVGHVRDLPERTLGVDIEHGFTPNYVLTKGKVKVVAELRKAAKTASAIYLAPDPDREGEAIAWHLQEVLADTAEGKPFYRVQYNEITARAVRAAFENPGAIDMNRVNAQQARRVLDRIVGYKVSPMLWSRVRRGLSAGRVQSVALRLVAEREREIQAFKVEEYWVLGANVCRQSPPKDPFMVRLSKVDGEKASVGSEGAAKALLANLDGCALSVSDVRTREVSRRPLPPFITSTLQQAASSVCGFSPNRTMGLAQKLYEGVDVGEGGAVGLITYMRTDSVNIARDAQAAAKDFIVATHGERYYPETPNFYKSRSGAQEAHEAIRPTDVTRTPESLRNVLDVPALRLYELIWKRFVASQMAAAKITQKSIDFQPAKVGLAHAYTFAAAASEVVFDGFLKVMALNIHKKKEEDEEEEVDEVDRLPPLAVGDAIEVLGWLSDRKETKPPPRYSEASLIRALESDGVGRPSTYASIIETLNSREYTMREKRQLTPTELGLMVNDLLVAKLDALFNVGFTAEMEGDLDHVEEGNVEWTQMMQAFYARFSKWMELAREPPADMKRVGAMLALLAHVEQWAPGIQRGKRTYSDDRFVTSVREQLTKGEKPVTDKQAETLAKIVLRYRSQIPDVEAGLAAWGYQELIESDKAMASNEETTQRFETLDMIVLSDSQVEFISSLREQVANGRKLSARQIAALDRIIVQNAVQFADFERIRKKIGLIHEKPSHEPDHESPALLEMLQQVTDWQEPVMRGKRTFDDKEFYASLAGQYARQQTLSPRQRGAMRRLVFRYKAQIPGFAQYAEKLGMTVPAFNKGN
ncbi:MAG: type I DNA topoisomerase [Kiritimatiellaeota bacterium]|nr:type I DNA topoisomerase [Kiritimatiellota bacterium]